MQRTGGSTAALVPILYFNMMLDPVDTINIKLMCGQSKPALRWTDVTTKKKLGSWYPTCFVLGYQCGNRSNNFSIFAGDRVFL